MLEEAKRILKTTFGHDAFRMNQESIIKALINGNDVLALMPTGGGKSLCFQIPGLLKDGLTIVISPLIALMKDQVDELRSKGIEAAYLNSTLNYEEQQSIFRAIYANQLKFLYIAPERLVNKEGSVAQFINFLRTVSIVLFAVDEAHCISMWGHDFRKEYAALAEVKKNFPSIPWIALTATADSSTRRDIIEQLSLHRAEVFVSSFNRPNIKYTVLPKKNYFEQLLDYLQGKKNQSGIIYTLSRLGTEKLSEDLNREGFKTSFYHAGLSQERRAQNQDDFLNNKIQIMVATVAFGMGINKPDVRFVIHTDLPRNLENYYQETGRAGRDGLASEAILFYSTGDTYKMRNFIFNDETENENKTRLNFLLKRLDQMVTFCETTACRRKLLLNYFGESTVTECGHCDNCCKTHRIKDISTETQMLLSALIRIQIKIGTTYLIHFLRGESKEVNPTHQTLKTFGIGKNCTKEEWILIVKELINQGIINNIHDKEYSYLEPSISAQEILKGTLKLTMSLPSDAPKKESLLKTTLPTETREQSLRLFKQGYSVEQIADIRTFSVGTVENHLCYYIAAKALNVDELVDYEKKELIKKAYQKFGKSSLTKLKNELGEDFSYSEIKFVINSLSN